MDESEKCACPVPDREYLWGDICFCEYCQKVVKDND
jgi:hypothetical protein